MIARWLMALAIVLTLPGALARTPAALSVLSPPDTPLGGHLTFLQEDSGPLSLPDAMRAQREGRFRTTGREVLGFGIGSLPLWVHLRLDNPASTPLPRRLGIGQSWLDRIEVNLVQGKEIIAHWITGDAIAGMPYLDDALGYGFDLVLPPGESELLIRVATDDPLVLNISLHTPQAATARARLHHYGYGLLYGFLLALVGYNLMLYAGLRQRNHLLYAVYLLTFIALNIGYTGHGAAWLWADAPGFQQYVVLVLMVLMPSAGLRFAESFLNLARHMPRTARAVRFAYWTGPLGIAVLTVLDRHEAAAWFAFVAVALFVVTMVALGVATVRLGYPAARYFLIASLAAMIGAALTEFTVLGTLPFTPLTYRGAEIGMMLDATLLALALAYFVRVQVNERELADRLARIDPLTHLLNRRAFVELAGPLFETARRHRRPLAAIMLDLDHFKALNDQHGHNAGDEALALLGQLLLQTARRGDVVARWGGEEFLMLLPETGLDAATALAERLRESVAQLRPSLAPGAALGASLGVAVLGEHASVDTLIAEADAALYQAKSQGRNRVCVAARAA